MAADADRACRRGTAHPRRRCPTTGAGIELVLLVFAAVLVTVALVLVEANQEQDAHPSRWSTSALAYLALVHASRTSRCAGSRRTPTR